MWLVFVVLVLSVVLLIVLSQVKISVTASDEFIIKIKFLFFTLYSYDSSINDEPKETEKVAKKGSINQTVTKITNCNNNFDKITTLIKMLKSVLLKVPQLLRHTHIKNFNLNVSVAGTDAADTAIKYGKVCSIVYPLSTLLSKCVNFKPESISVYSDFNGSDTNYNLMFLTSVRGLYLMGFAVSSVFEIIKLRMGVK